MKILDLFSGTQSVKKAYPDSDYIGIDIIGDDNVYLDMTQYGILEELEKVLPKGWKPDVIWASPPCYKLSRASCIPGGTLSFVIEDDELRLREDNEFSHITHNNFKHLKDNKDWRFKQVLAGAHTLIMVDNMKRIIKHFNVPFIIENPRNSLIKLLLKEYKQSYCSYCRYGFDYQKNTTIYSNVKFDLLKCDHKGKHSNNLKWFGGTKNRSKVPPKLIKELIDQIKK